MVERHHDLVVDRVRVNSHRVSLLPEKATEYQWYDAFIVAYQGDSKWALGLVHDTQDKAIDWFRDMSWEEMILLQVSTKNRVRRKSEEQLFGKE